MWFAVDSSASDTVYHGEEGMQGGTQFIMVGKECKITHCLSWCGWYTGRDTVHPGGEGIQAGAGGKCSHCMHSQ